MQKKHYEVVAAVIFKTEDGVEKIFCAKRPGPKPGKEANESNYKWEFPGGKIEPGETREHALAREISEEFGAQIEVGDFLMTVEHEYSAFSITMHAFCCRLMEGRLELREHLESKWLGRGELNSLDWAAADIPIMKKISGVHMKKTEAIQNQFNEVSEEYDRNRRRFIPCFEDYYSTTTEFIASSIPAPKRIVDLGAGTGLLSYFWYRHFPESQFVLVDIAEEMLNVAKKRFSSINNVSFKAMDYSAKLPDEECDCFVSALSIHHLENEEKASLFSRIYEKLPLGGIFVNYDQFCGTTEKFSSMMDAHWIRGIESSGLSEKDIALWRERAKLDRECSLESEIEMLRKAGFSSVQCVYSFQKFSVVMAVK